MRVRATGGYGSNEFQLNGILLEEYSDNGFQLVQLENGSYHYFDPERIVPDSFSG